MGKEIVAKFNEDYSGIEFYRIEMRYKHYTLISLLGHDHFYIWDNKVKVLSMDFIGDIPDSKQEFKELIASITSWDYADYIFFWADSKLVTDFGLPHYNKLLKIYKELIEMRYTRIQFELMLEDLKIEDNWFIYLKYKFLTTIMMIKQNKTIRKCIKEFKLIW